MRTFHLWAFCALVPDLSLGMERLAAAAPDGNSTSSSWCFATKSTARCCNLKGYRLIVNSTSNFMLLIKVCNNLRQRCKVWGKCPSLPIKRSKFQSRIYLFAKPNLTRSSSTLWTYPVYTVIGWTLSSDKDTLRQSPRSTDGRFSATPGHYCRKDKIQKF